MLAGRKTKNQHYSIVYHYFKLILKSPFLLKSVCFSFLADYFDSYFSCRLRLILILKKSNMTTDKNQKPSEKDTG